MQVMLSDGQMKKFLVGKMIMEYSITLRQIEMSAPPCPSSEPGTSQPQEEIIL